MNRCDEKATENHVPPLWGHGDISTFPRVPLRFTLINLLTRLPALNLGGHGSSTSSIIYGKYTAAVLLQGGGLSPELISVRGHGRLIAGNNYSSSFAIQRIGGLQKVSFR
jgi:hypothetical protein